MLSHAAEVDGSMIGYDYPIVGFLWALVRVLVLVGGPVLLVGLVIRSLWRGRASGVPHVDVDGQTLARHRSRGV